MSSSSTLDPPGAPPGAPSSALAAPLRVSRWLHIDPEVRSALEQDRPVVALESTIITHGMPWPANFETAQAVEATVRDHHAVPATIAVMDGKIHVGLSPDALEALAKDEHAAKLSRRDLAAALTRGNRGGTTVAATMLCAQRAGIRVFATGGIGGVHRGGEHSMDVSADLDELARTPVAVVCAGCKAILDIPRTLEVLETHGVPVIGFGCDELPAFYTRTSGCPAPLRLDEPSEVAALMHAQWDLGLSSGVLVANPVPEADAMDPAQIEHAITRALADAEDHGIIGKDVTPYLLARVVELTGEQSLRSNIALVQNNARLAARIAHAFHRQLS